jgi:hypothetical protein
MISHEDAKAQLDGLHGKKLVAYFNTLAVRCGEPETKRFSSLASGRKRCLRLMALCGIISPTEAVVRRRKPRQKVWRYPPNGRQDGAPALSTPNTLYWRIQVALMAGETFERIKGIVEDYDIMRGITPHNIEWRAYKLIRTQHIDYGWGLREELRGGEVHILMFSDIPPKQLKKTISRRGGAHAI